MWKYYEIWDIEDQYRSMFDTIAEVARLCRISYNKIINILGFKNNNDIKILMLDPPTNHFSVEHLLCTRLNSILRDHDVPLRIVMKRQKYLNWWYKERNIAWNSK